MDKKITSFIADQKVLTLCTAIDDNPYCASCFYAYLSDDKFLVFKSAEKTIHITNALMNRNIAGTIIPDISSVGTIKGIQFTGKFIVPHHQLGEAKRAYYGRYPFALPMPGEIWIIELTSVKMTDNTLGFGKKLIWEK